MILSASFQLWRVCHRRCEGVCSRTVIELHQSSSLLHAFFYSIMSHSMVSTAFTLGPLKHMPSRGAPPVFHFSLSPSSNPEPFSLIDATASSLRRYARDANPRIPRPSDVIQERGMQSSSGPASVCQWFNSWPSLQDYTVDITEGMDNGKYYCCSRPVLKR